MRAGASFRLAARLLGQLRIGHAHIAAARESVDAACNAQERHEQRGRATMARTELETRERERIAALLAPRSEQRIGNYAVTK